MNSKVLVCMLVVAGCAAAAVAWFGRGFLPGGAEAPAASRTVPAAAAKPHAESALKGAVRSPAPPPVALPADRTRNDTKTAAPTPVVSPDRSADPGSWTVSMTAKTAEPSAAEPVIDEAMARAALRAVGKDPAAEAIWRRAINDPGLPRGVRSDLIEDLNDEGYADPDHLTQDDLPLILARLRLIEELSPLAMDEVNAAAFAEAYKDLLDMLARLRASSG
jgi:hypothetical protein